MKMNKGLEQGLKTIMRDIMTIPEGRPLGSPSPSSSSDALGPMAKSECRCGKDANPDGPRFDILCPKHDSAYLDSCAAAAEMDLVLPEVTAIEFKAPGLMGDISSVTATSLGGKALSGELRILYRACPPPA